MTTITNNLEDLDECCLRAMGQITAQLEENGLPDGFAPEGLHFIYDSRLMCVYLCNDNGQRATLGEDGFLEIYVR